MQVKHHLSQSTTDPEFYRLVVPFYHSYDTLLTEDYTVEVTLPNGAKNIKVSFVYLNLVQVHVPFEVDEINYDGKSYGTLEFWPSTKVSIKLKNANSLLNAKDFAVTYTLPSH